MDDQRAAGERPAAATARGSAAPGCVAPPSARARRGAARPLAARRARGERPADAQQQASSTGGRLSAPRPARQKPATGTRAAAASSPSEACCPARSRETQLARPLASSASPARLARLAARLSRRRREGGGREGGGGGVRLICLPFCKPRALPHFLQNYGPKNNLRYTDSFHCCVRGLRRHGRSTSPWRTETR